MVLSEISIKRPVLATVMSLLIVLVGFLSFTRMAVREYPNIDPPVVSVRTVYKGATAQVMESAITQPLEDSLSGIEGIKTIKSQSREEVSQITITFVAAREIDGAANDVRDRVARIRKNLPAASDNSVVSKIEADAQPILWIALTSDRHSPMEMTDYADRYLTDPLKALPGRGFGDHRRRAQVRHARLARPRAPRGAGADRAGRGGRAESPEPRLSGRAHREHAARIHRAGAHRSALAGRIQQHDHQGGERLSHPPQGRRAAPRPARTRTARSCACAARRRSGWASSSSPPPTRWKWRRPPRRCCRTCRPRSQPGMKMWVAVDTSKFIEASIKSVLRDHHRWR